MASLVGREAARQAATSGSTKDKQARSRDRWLKFLQRIEYNHHPQMAELQPWQRLSLLSAFAHCLREALFSSSSYDTLASGTVRDSVDHVASSIRDSAGFDPRLDCNGNYSRLLLQQFRGYKASDPPTHQQKAIPPIIIRELHKSRRHPEDVAAAQLVTGAWFFAMRSCEYSHTPANEVKRTKLLRLRNLTFRSQGEITPITSPCITQATTITITFESQKNTNTFESITMHRSQDPTLCPVKAWAAIARRILSYPGTTLNTPVNTILHRGQLCAIKSSTILLKLRHATSIIGQRRLGFTAKDVGTHSIRSGAAMAMYLDNVPIFTIMLIGRWHSDAFLRYIRKQVEQFSHNVSNRMLTHNDWFTIPTYTPFQTPTTHSTTDHPRCRPGPPFNVGPSGRH